MTVFVICIQCRYIVSWSPGYDGWAVMEWECCIKSAQQGAEEGAPFIAKHIIQAAQKAFDDFAGSKSNSRLNKKILGL